MKQIINDYKYSKIPTEYNKFTKKEILQYAVGGLLYMPATRSKIAEEIIHKTNENFNSICLDLEDAVGVESVKEAEYTLINTIKKINKAIKNNQLTYDELPLIFVRVRRPQQLYNIKRKLTTEELNVLTGFNFPKLDKSNIVEYLKAFNFVKKNVKTPLYFMPILESQSIMNKETRLEELLYIQQKLSIHSNNILNIRVGATDFCNIFGLRRKQTQNIYQMNVIADCFKDIINVFGKNYVIAGPVWEYFGKEEGQWSIGLQKELELDSLNGFIGKTCIHPSQLKYIKLNNIVNYEDYQDALNILGMSNGLIGVTKGYNNNKMNEVATHSKWAKKIINLSEIYGVDKDE